MAASSSDSTEEEKIPELLNPLTTISTFDVEQFKVMFEWIDKHNVEFYLRAKNPTWDNDTLAATINTIDTAFDEVIKATIAITDYSKAPRRSDNVYGDIMNENVTATVKSRRTSIPNKHRYMLPKIETIGLFLIDIGGFYHTSTKPESKTTGELYRALVNKIIGLKILSNKDTYDTLNPIINNLWKRMTPPAGIERSSFKIYHALSTYLIDLYTNVGAGILLSDTQISKLNLLFAPIIKTTSLKTAAVSPAKSNEEINAPLEEFDSSFSGDDENEESNSFVSRQLHNSVAFEI